ncbi:MAG TPA: histidine kinase [Chitinophagaceae bacterium]|jgi:sensor histidine kinase YesM|nr:histidine kinase [Chitinophagaceae bacterium]
MVRDFQLRLLFIPLLGLLIPAVSGIIVYEKYSAAQIIISNCYFILTSFIIWGGCNWIHARLRPLFRKTQNPFFKILSISIVSALYAAASGGAMTMIWFRISKEAFTWNKFFGFIAFTIMAVLMFTLVYEILFLSKERELDTKIVEELDRERMEAELDVLNNELDPHFIFNALNTLNHLIITNPDTAYLFNSRLAQVYKYVLMNKNKELVSLFKELEFIESYFFLLQIRYENKLVFELDAKDAEIRKIMMPPCTLQTVVENAIKHNEFSAENPLMIKLSLNGEYVKVSNNKKPKPYLVDSTSIGLRNLSSRYMLLCNKNIIIENEEFHFLVKLPLISNL